MNLTNMAVEKQNDVEPYEPNPYGYGLTLNLTDKQCEALGVISPMKVGTKVEVHAASFVCETKEYASRGEDGKTSIYLSLQITDLALTEGAKAEPGKVLYGE